MERNYKKLYNIIIKGNLISKDISFVNESPEFSPLKAKKICLRLSWPIVDACLSINSGVPAGSAGLQPGYSILNENGRSDL